MLTRLMRSAGAGLWAESGPFAPIKQKKSCTGGPAGHMGFRDIIVVHWVLLSGATNVGGAPKGASTLGERRAGSPHRGALAPAILLLVCASLTADASPVLKAPVLGIEVLTEREGVGPGDTLKVAIRVTVNQGFHLNGHVPSQEYLVPTTLEVDPQPGVFVDEWSFPRGETMRFPFADEPLTVYQGTFLIRGAFHISGNASLRKRRVVVHLHYQACTAERCYAPLREEIPVDFQVVRAGKATRPLHPDVFSPRHF